MTCFAPMPYSSLACSALRTMFTRPMPSSWQILFSIWPRFDAAAVCTSALWPSRFIVSVIPSAVSGLTNHEAPSAAVVPAGRGWQSVAFRSRYCAYIAPPIIDTVLPSSACAASDEPALITVPAPSLPTGIAWSRRAAMKGSACSGTLAVILMAAPLPDALAVLMSAGPSSRPRSDGLIGVASTLTKTWSGPGSGIGTSASDSSSSPLFLIRERSCNPFVVPLMSTSPLYPFMRALLASTSGSRGKCLRNRTELLRCRRHRPSANRRHSSPFKGVRSSDRIVWMKPAKKEGCASWTRGKGRGCPDGATSSWHSSRQQDGQGARSAAPKTRPIGSYR